MSSVHGDTVDSVKHGSEDAVTTATPDEKSALSNLRETPQEKIHNRRGEFRHVFLIPHCRLVNCRTVNHHAVVRVLGVVDQRSMSSIETAKKKWRNKSITTSCTR